MRIEVDDQHMFADGSKRGTQIDCGCCFADPALLVSDRQHARTRCIGPDCLFCKGHDQGINGLLGDWVGHFPHSRGVRRASS